MQLKQSKDVMNNLAHQVGFDKLHPKVINVLLILHKKIVDVSLTDLKKFILFTVNDKEKMKKVNF